MALGLLFSFLMNAGLPGKAAGFGRNALEAVDDPLAGWTMHTVNGLTPVPAAKQSARATAIAKVPRNIASDAVDVGRSASKSVKKVTFDDVTEIRQYKQRMGRELWTSVEDERRAVAEVMSQELGAGKTSSTITQPMGATVGIKQKAPKKLTVIERAMVRRQQ